MDRRRFLGAAAGAVVIAKPYLARASVSELLVAEPVHSIGYLPMYVAMDQGFFKEADINVKIVTIETGAGHTNAVLTGQAFAFIGGPEHNAFAKLKGAELRTVVNCVDRGNVYLSAAKGLAPDGRDFAGFVKGKTIAVGQVGGTPNSILRYLLKTWNLDAKSDVGLVEVANSAVPPSVKSKAAQIGVVTEPFITQGVKAGFMEEPFFNVPKELGPYAYSTINTRLDMIQKEPAMVKGFVRGIMKALQLTYAKPDAAADVAKKQFPTMARDDLKATLDRSFADSAWSKDGTVSRAAWATAQSVVRGADILKSDVKYDDIIDMSFVDSLHASL